MRHSKSDIDRITGDGMALRILTDIRIAQSPSWTSKTEYLGDRIRSSPFFSGLSNASRIISTVSNFLNIVKYRNDYDVIVNANVRTGQLFALFKSFFRINRPKQIILELMLDEPRNSVLWKLKKRLQRFIFSSIDVIFVSSTREVIDYSGRFGFRNDRFRFLPFHTNIIEPEMVESSGDYILSAGKTGRDYGTFCAAVEDLDYQFIIVSDRLSTRGMKFPRNVEVLYDIPYPRYLSVLKNCRFVVVPLKKLVKSTGQVVLLEAMAQGKPVIATETTGTLDYIRPGINGLLTPVGDWDLLRRAIESLIQDPQLHRTLAKNGLKSIQERHTFKRYTDSIIQAANEIAH